MSSLTLSTARAKCPLCDYSASQISSSPEHAWQTVADAVRSHIKAAHHYVVCSVCSLQVTLRGDGMVRVHGPRHERCGGSGNLPWPLGKGSPRV